MAEVFFFFFVKIGDVCFLFLSISITFLKAFFVVVLFLIDSSHTVFFGDDLGVDCRRL